MTMLCSVDEASELALLRLPLSHAHCPSPVCRYVPGSKAIVSAVSPNDQLMAIISRDGLLRFWAMQTRELLRITKATVLQFTGVRFAAMLC